MCPVLSLWYVRQTLSIVFGVNAKFQALEFKLYLLQFADLKLGEREIKVTSHFEKKFCD